MNLGIVFEPLVSWPLWTVAAALSVVVICIGFWKGLLGAWLRLLASALLLAVLAGPVLQSEERSKLDDIVLLVVDETASQNLGARAAQTQAAEAEVVKLLNARSGTTLKRKVVKDGADNSGTLVIEAIAQALKEEPRNRIAGVIVISDGLIHDASRILDLPAPLHHLRSGYEADWDRRLEVSNAPAFAIVGEAIELNLSLSDEGAAPEAEQFTQLSVAVGAEDPFIFDVPVGREISLPVTLPRAGRNLIKLEVPVGEGELTGRNNSRLLEINGVRERLRVLLVSGEPHAGGRTWRNLLKSDSSVDLVHFTILRPPEKHDGVPVGELSLIAFPTRELFIDKIDDFDLIIFDRYKRRGILPAAYLENVRTYVEKGGAVLIAAGPDFASADSLYRSPLEPIVPASPTARVFEQAFLPRVSETGERHPVLRGLEPNEPSQTWGRWMRQVELDDITGDVLMEGIEGRPLLVLKRAGEGRLALLASDHAWLWARGFEGGGPQLELLRRLSHWLMKEPELEEEALVAEPSSTGLDIVRQSLETSAEDVTVTTPSGKTIVVELKSAEPGLYSGELASDEIGLFRLQAGDLAYVVGRGTPSPKEFERTIATSAPLEAALNQRRGGAHALENGLPRFRAVSEGRNATGNGWLGLYRRAAYETQAIRQFPLLPPWLALVLFGGFVLAAWLREGRR